MTVVCRYRMYLVVIQVSFCTHITRVQSVRESGYYHSCINTSFFSGYNRITNSSQFYMHPLSFLFVFMSSFMVLELDFPWGLSFSLMVESPHVSMILHRGRLYSSSLWITLFPPLYFISLQKQI